MENAFSEYERLYLEMRALYSANRYEEVLEKCTPLAERGNAVAQYFLGECYGHGNGVKWDAETGTRWYRKALEGLHELSAQGYIRANYLIGDCHRHGQGVEYSNLEAMKWFAKALEGYMPLAEAGDSEALYMVGRAYHFEEGVKPDPVKAFGFWEQAAQQGHTLAQYQVANCYNFGLVCGVKEDSGKALYWYKQAAAQGVVNAMSSVGCYYYWGHGVEKSYQTAWEWYKKAFDNGCSDTDSMFLFGMCWLKIEKRDPVEAVKWLEAAAYRGDSESREMLEKLAEEGVEEADDALFRIEQSEW